MEYSMLSLHLGLILNVQLPISTSLHKSILLPLSPISDLHD